ncbi:MAG: glycosyltransferase [Erythrobacter sp.]
MNDRPHHSEVGASPLPRICHVSADFPDPIVPDKTPVIRSFLELTQGRFDHRVLSINRTSPAMRHLFAGRSAPAKVEFARFDWGECLTYEAPARGLFHRSSLEKLADTLAARIEEGPLPDLLVGHKLTVEGIVVHRIAKQLGVPYALTIQGNTDAKILAARPDLAPLFRTIFHGARSVTVFAPWALSRIEAKLGKRTGPVALIPCPTELDRALAPCTAGNGLLSVFHLRGHANKNLAGMAEALRILAGRGSPQSLTICGGGSEADVAEARASTRNAPGLVFEGPLARDEVAARMNAATAFVLPSLRESFGLVFIEALFAGLPIIYPQGIAVSGWFDDCPFAIPVPARDPAALAEAMAHAARSEERLKQALARWQASGAADRFRRTAIASAYGDALAAALAGAAA